MIDLKHLEKYVVGDLGLRDEILTIFADQAKTLSQTFSVEAADKAWVDIAHALKGASRGVGAWEVGDLCEEAEAMVGEMPGKTERRAAILVSIRQKLTATFDDIQRLRELAA